MTDYPAPIGGGVEADLLDPQVVPDGLVAAGRGSAASTGDAPEDIRSGDVVPAGPGEVCVWSMGVPNVREVGIVRPLHWLGAGLLWILAGVVGLLGVVFSITVILLPLGLPLLALARRLFGQSMKLVLPRTVTQPGKELKKSVRKKGTKVADAMPEVDAGPVTDRLHEVRRKAGKAVKRSKRQVSF